MRIARVLGSQRGTRNLLGRVINIFRRFGITPRKMAVMLRSYVDITEEFGCEPTFPITAVTLRRHPVLIRELDRRGVELAIHGYIHIDHRSLSAEEQYWHFKKAMDVFHECEISFTGFRAPYLRSNAGTLEALNRLGLAYDSSCVVHWNAVDRDRFGAKAWQEYADLLDYYSTQDADSCLVLPRSQNGVTVIPVSIPDDEALVGRLGIKDEKEIARIWEAIFRETYSRGELFTVQLHHERVPFCGSALKALLRKARELSPPVWIATLGEIARWWKERETFNFAVSHLEKGRWSVAASCSDRATVLIRNCGTDQPARDWANGYKSIDARNFVVESAAYPAVGVAPDSSEDAVDFLRSEGYAVEVSDRSQMCAVYLDNLAKFTKSDEKRIAEAIEHSDAGLVRFWRWPESSRSALAITGDIDSITLIDFVMRVIEGWRQRLASRVGDVGKSSE
jgi:peptidoglycan/xylan/chitin deacetylase (PgdA/CDA1 family)